MFRFLRWVVILFVWFLVVGCTGEPKQVNKNPPAPKRQVQVSLGSKVIQTIPERFLSVAVDSAQIVGGKFWDPAGSTSLVGNVKVPVYDFSRPQLRMLAKALAPAYLRIGGSAADEVYYDFSDSSVKEPPKHYKYVMTRKMWDGIHDFATQLDFRLMFTINAGPGPRKDNTWTPDNARTLLQYATKKKSPVDVWELGNEINGYRLLLGIDVGPEQYTKDLKAAKELLTKESPGTKLAGPSCAFWPDAGDFLGFYDKFIKEGGKYLDIVTWHYYPQQSIRCAARTLPAGSEVMLKPKNLNEIQKWSSQVQKGTSVHGKTVWLGETGNAQCGGEPGVSDAFAGGFWWMDQLGQMAANGNKLVVRQTLSGSNYGLVNDKTLEPKPDYWNSLLWRRLMGQKVLQVEQKKEDTMLRQYAHCTYKKYGSPKGAVTFLFLNLDPKEKVRVTMNGLKGKVLNYKVTAKSMKSTDLKLNGVVMALKDGKLPELKGEEFLHIDRTPFVDIEPRSYALVVLPDTNHPLCR